MPNPNRTAAKDSIFGTIAGHAIGDALGLGTEFLTRKQVSEYYPSRLIKYDQIIQDAHRRRWTPGDWTDDTDQMLCIMDSLIEKQQVDCLDIAKRLYQWAANGGMGIGRSTLSVLSSRSFLSDPHLAAKSYWESTGKQVAANGGVMRTSVLGLWNHEGDTLLKNVEDVCKITHYDPRCVGSCVAVCLTIKGLTQGEKDLKSLLTWAGEVAVRYDGRMMKFIDLALNGSLEDLELDGGKTPGDGIGYTLKAMAAGLWSVRNAKTFQDGLLQIIHEGDDSDTNGAVAGALLGARFGQSGIPGDWFAGLARVDELLHRWPRFEACLNALSHH